MGPDGFIAYTFQFETGFSIPSILLDGDVAEVQSYLLQVQRLVGCNKDWVRGETNAETCRAIEARIRFQMSDQLRAAETDRLRCAKLAEECEALRARVEEMRSATRADEDGVRTRLESSWRERLAEIKAESAGSLDLLRQQLEIMCIENRSLMEKLIGREMQLKSSQGRGRIGEDAFAEAAAAACGWQLERSAGVARACDFKMRVANFDVRFEIKNHGTSIPGADIQKFYRDMEEHREHTGVGVFIALNVGLTGRRTVSHEWRNDQLLLFVSAFNDADTDFIFLTLRHLIDVYARYRALHDQRTMALEEMHVAEQLATLRARIDSAMIHINSQGGHMKELRLKLQRDKKSVVKMFDDSAELLASAQSEFDMTLRLLLGNDAVEETPILPVEEAAQPKKRAAAKRKPPTASMVSLPLDGQSSALVEATAL